jgi:hypothetical protein
LAETTTTILGLIVTAAGVLIAYKEYVEKPSRPVLDITSAPLLPRESREIRTMALNSTI